jgi:hypothetical protein
MRTTKAIIELQKLVAEHGDQESTVYNGDPVDPASVECEEIVVNKDLDGNLTFEAI